MENTMKMYVTADEAAQILGVSKGYLVIKQHTGAWVPLTSLLWRGACFWSAE